MYADNTSGHNLMRYSTSNSPYGPFKDGGVILDATSCDTTHGSIVEYKNHWYMFYHNSDLSGRGNLRSVCVDEVFFNEDGSIQKVIRQKMAYLLLVLLFLMNTNLYIRHMTNQNL